MTKLTITMSYIYMLYVHIIQGLMIPQIEALERRASLSRGLSKTKNSSEGKGNSHGATGYNQMNSNNVYNMFL